MRGAEATRLLQALASASEQLAHPISTELGRTIHEMNIGSSAEEALVNLSERSGISRTV